MKPTKLNRRPRDGRVTRGTQNVFADLGLNPSDAADLQLKAELTRQIYHRVKTLGLTQIQAAERLKISQPDVSKLMNARFTGYSTDRLISLLSALAVDVEIVLRPRKNAESAAGMVRVRPLSKVA